jgi:hypothetical protein
MLELFVAVTMNVHLHIRTLHLSLTANCLHMLRLLSVRDTYGERQDTRNEARYTKRGTTRGARRGTYQIKDPHPLVVGGRVDGEDIIGGDRSVEGLTDVGVDVADRFRGDAFQGVGCGVVGGSIIKEGCFKLKPI